MKRFFWLTILGGILAFLPTAPLRAGDEAAAKMGKWKGEVQSIDKVMRTLLVREDEEVKTFRLADDVRLITENNKEVKSLDNLKPGDEITVKYTDENGTMVAREIDDIDLESKEKD